MLSWSLHADNTVAVLRNEIAACRMPGVCLDIGNCFVAVLSLLLRCCCFAIALLLPVGRVQDASHALGHQPYRRKTASPEDGVLSDDDCSDEVLPHLVRSALGHCPPEGFATLLCAQQTTKGLVLWQFMCMVCGLLMSLRYWRASFTFDVLMEVRRQMSLQSLGS